MAVDVEQAFATVGETNRRSIDVLGPSNVTW